MFFVPAVNERTNGARSVFANQKNFFLNITRLARYFPSIYNTKNKKQKSKNQKKIKKSKIKKKSKNQKIKKSKKNQRR